MVTLETPTTNEIKLHLCRKKCSGEVGGDGMVKRRVIMWLQNHRRSRRERQINFPELCMDNSIAIWRTSFDIFSTIGITICMREYVDYSDNFC